jgi:polyisoprenoid-binding protein YceI
MASLSSVRGYAIWFAVSIAHVFIVATTSAQTAPEAAATPAAGLTAGATYTIDPTHTFVLYEIGHYGTSTNRGRFNVRDGSVRVAADGASARIDITMDIATVSTGVDVLNRHILSKDFLDVARWPVARFFAERAAITHGKITTAAGTLELRGATRPMTLVAKRFNCYLSPMLDRQVCGGDFAAVIRRSDFGITWGLDVGFEDEVQLLIQVEAIATQPH